MKSYLWLIFLTVLLSGQSYSQIVLSPQAATMVEVGDIVELRVISGQEIITDDMVKNKFGKTDQNKIMFMKVYRDKNEIVVRAVLAGKFNPQEVIQLEGGGEGRTLTFENIQINPLSMSKRDISYIDVPLIPKKNYIRVLIWIVGALCSVLMIGIIIWFARRYMKRKNSLKIKERWLSRLESSTSLSACSEIWLEREKIRSDFPDLVEDINRFFSALSPDQFQLSSREDLSEDIKRERESLIKKLKEKKVGI